MPEIDQKFTRNSQKFAPGCPAGRNRQVIRARPIEPRLDGRAGPGRGCASRHGVSGYVNYEQDTLLSVSIQEQNGNIERACAGSAPRQWRTARSDSAGQVIWQRWFYG